MIENILNKRNPEIDVNEYINDTYELFNHENEYSKFEIGLQVMDFIAYNRLPGDLHQKEKADEMIDYTIRFNQRRMGVLLLFFILFSLVSALLSLFIFGFFFKMNIWLNILLSLIIFGLTFMLLMRTKSKKLSELVIKTPDGMVSQELRDYLKYYSDLKL